MTHSSPIPAGPLRHRRTVGLLMASLAPVGLLLAGCTAEAKPATVTSASTQASTSSVTLLDGWAKSTDSMPADGTKMTGVFGTLKNSGTTPITITGGTSPAGRMVSVHETVKTGSGAMQMQEAKAGFTIPPGGTFELKPGANHIMIMDLTRELKVGDVVSIDLASTSGVIPVTAAVRAFTGANESYAPDASPSMSQ